jgi:hypothetical protein
MHEQKPPWGLAWTRRSRTLLLWLHRCQLFVGIVGRRWHGDRLTPHTAWAVACIVYAQPRRKEKTV